MCVCVCVGGGGHGGLGQFPDLKGGLARKRVVVFLKGKGGGVFEGAVDTPMHNMFIKLLRNLRY